MQREKPRRNIFNYNYLKKGTMMARITPGLAIALVATFWTTQLVHAQLLFDQNVTPDVIFGSGNANGGFTVNQDNGVELGLRGKLRHNASGQPENTFSRRTIVDNKYYFDAGVAPTQSFPTAEWSFEWSINTDDDASTGLNLSSYQYALRLDTNPGADISWMVFDPINDANSSGSVLWDHAIGDNSTGNGAGSVATDSTSYLNLIQNNNVAQNSWKPHWFISGFDPTVDGTYDFELEAYKAGSSVAKTNMQIIVGQGGTPAAPVPEPASVLMWSLLGTVGLGIGYYRRRRAV